VNAFQHDDHTLLCQSCCCCQWLWAFTRKCVGMSLLVYRYKHLTILTVYFTGSVTLCDPFYSQFNKQNGTLGLPASIKVHCSQGQTCANHDDPRQPGVPLNFNFLPTYATPSLGVMPHTVQAYGLDDFAADVYGNPSFQEMLDYLLYEAEQGTRSVCSILILLYTKSSTYAVC
jgi:hypothetical protein